MREMKVSSEKNGLIVKIDEDLNLSEYILGIRVNPFADDWIATLIETLCKKYKLKYMGKSDILSKVK